MQVVYEMTPVIADIISGHCPGMHARQEFMNACVRSDWAEARVLVRACSPNRGT